ncbi:hypothetical protein [Ramlibacter pallidus]|uniref:Lipocalin-like domain-containing protein n=1 Tax=Ramlibacter pallidus TaxID=2780087 RepID=A0ABR9S3C7_9BURK|nr:hypothetical protein [Ramlibacter pallidus]MBE7368007.1 hypothetical protein [Ramlibacter pallidus]
MKPFAISLLFSIALIAPCIHAAAPDPALVGCWRAVKIVQHFASGAKAEDSTGRCVLQFTDDRLESSCASSGGTVTSKYSYRIARPNVYAATLTGSTFQTSLIGSTREYEYRLEGDRLTTATNLQSTDAATPALAVRVETEGARIECR